MMDATQSRESPNEFNAVGRRRSLNARLAAAARWLHLYLSMLGLFALLSFSVTGITLNHADWFSTGARKTQEIEGQVEVGWLRHPATEPATSNSVDPARFVARLEVVEFLRSKHSIRGAVASFDIDDLECAIVFKGPGHATDVFIDRETGKYRMTVTNHGLIAILNDLHKGRDTGEAWSLVIDISAVVLTLASMTGLGLLFFIKRRRVPGLIAGLLGTLILVLIVLIAVP